MKSLFLKIKPGEILNVFCLSTGVEGEERKELTFAQALHLIVVLSENQWDSWFEGIWKEQSLK